MLRSFKGKKIPYRIYFQDCRLQKANNNCVVSLAQCNVHAMQSSCFQRGQSQLALPCRTKLASMSTCTSPSERTQYCSEQYGKLLVYNVRCFGPSRKYFHMTFAGSAVPPTKSCPRDITPHSRYIYSTHLCLNIVFATNRELSVFSPVLLWQLKSYLLQHFCNILCSTRSIWPPWTRILAT